MLSASPVVAQSRAAIDLVEACGGYRLEIAVTDDGAVLDAGATGDARDILFERIVEHRLFGAGMVDAIDVLEPGRIMIHRAGRADLGYSDEAVFGGGAVLALYLVTERRSDAGAGPGETAFADAEGTVFVMDPEPLIAEMSLAAAEAAWDQNATPGVSVRMTQETADAFARMSEQNVGNVIAVVLGDRVLTAPVLQSPIYGRELIVTGSYTVAEAEALAQEMMMGAFPYEVRRVEEQIIGARTPDAPNCAAMAALVE